MLKLIIKNLVPAIYLFTVMQVSGQQNLNDIQAAFHQYNNSSLTEKVFAHTDKHSREHTFRSLSRDIWRIAHVGPGEHEADW